MEINKNDFEKLEEQLVLQIVDFLYNSNMDMMMMLFEIPKNEDMKDVKIVKITDKCIQLMGSHLKNVNGTTLYESFPDFYKTKYPQMYIEYWKNKKTLEYVIEYEDEHISKNVFNVTFTPILNNYALLYIYDGYKNDSFIATISHVPQI